MSAFEIVGLIVLAIIVLVFVIRFGLFELLLDILIAIFGGGGSGGGDSGGGGFGGGDSGGGGSSSDW